MSALPQELGELHLHRLLVAVDGSASSDLALAAAVTAARRDNASLTLVTVAPDTVAEAARWPGGFTMPAMPQAEADAAADRTLRDAVARVPQDIPVTTVLRHGRPGPEVAKLAASGDFDAVLLGARGVGRVGALMGSVSHHVLHHAPIAVFVAHAPRGGALADAA
ncbi:universal stress protein [Conexibacter sp. SYSU D00693]|uniref:universal stress protein n=1 Tax=Conexibacter sp. SYSU D00693 TaxID=2812560 RepID=UPI00196A4EA1|nr:universal stress protein [Conexibacter sp. SYSU D00693]